MKSLFCNEIQISSTACNALCDPALLPLDLCSHTLYYSCVHHTCNLSEPTRLVPASELWQLLKSHSRSSSRSRLGLLLLSLLLFSVFPFQLKCWKCSPYQLEGSGITLCASYMTPAVRLRFPRNSESSTEQLVPTAGGTAAAARI